MKKLAVSLNILHYCIYVIHYKLHLSANKINPFWLLAELPFLKKRYEKFGINIHEQVDIAFGDKRFGLSIIVARAGLIGILFLFIMATALWIIYLMNLNIVLTVPYFIIFISIPIIVCHFFVSKHDKYLKYFKEFEKWTNVKKRKNVYLSICFIIAVLFLFLGSMMH